jgi:hypothetical protein
VADETVAPPAAAERPRIDPVETSDMTQVDHVDDEADDAWPQLPQAELEVCLGNTLKPLTAAEDSDVVAQRR